MDAPHRFSYEGEIYEIALASDSDYAGDYFDRAVAAESLVGKGVVEKKRDGYGAALVGIREQRPGRETEMAFYPLRGLHTSVTLTLGTPHRAGRGAESRTIVPLALRNPLLRETVAVDGHRYPLAANFSAPVELLLSGRNEMLWGLGGFFDAEKRATQSGIYLLEPYDPDRIPVIMTHGLVSVPIIWRDLIPNLMAEPDISRRYQFMLFTYPSSYSVVESALLYRSELAALRQQYDPKGNDPLSTGMVAIGHSMGGVLTHLLVADVGDTAWEFISDVPLDEMPIDDEKKARLRSLVYFDPDPAVDRAVYLSTPHLGAEMATASFAGFFSRLVRLPGNVLSATTSILTDQDAQYLKISYGKRLTSIQSLRPDSVMAQTLAVAPYREGVVYHSIIGDRGRGDTPDSSDGVVEYWSSHQEGAASELIVPTGHTSYTHPKSVAEIKRILRVNAGLPTEQ